MKRLIAAGFALVLFVPALALAQDAFTGTWKMDASTVHQTGRPLVIHLKDGVYRCNCTPPIEVKADGADHAVKGHAGFDTLAVKVIDDHSIQETEKKDGKVTHEGTFTVAADGKTATNAVKNYRDGAEAFAGSIGMTRVGKPVAGSNAVAGTWQMSHVSSASGELPADSYTVSGNDISYKTPSGDSYAATIGGKAVPFMASGKQDGTVSVKRLGKDTLRETYMHDGKVTLTSTMTVSADGKTMKTTNRNLKSGVTTSWVADKQ